MILVIEGPSSATLTIDFGAGDVLVYKSIAGYDPLCRSLFTYRAADSTPPDDCQWYDRLCVVGVNTCCPDMGYPQRLYVNWEDPEGFCPCSLDDSGTYFLTLSYVNPLFELATGGVRARWTLAALPFCGEGLKNMWVECRFIVPTGYEFFTGWESNTPGDPDGCGANEEEPVGITDRDPDTSCLPFVLTTLTAGHLGGARCCPDSDNITLFFTL